VRVRANGTFVVYKGADQVGVHTAEASDANFQEHRIQGPLAGQFKAYGAISVQREQVNLLCLPHRYRELEIVADAGGGSGFSHVFTDLEPGTENVICPAGKFWWQVPSEFRASVQVTPVKFANSGTAYGRFVPFRYNLNFPRTWSLITAGGKIGDPALTYATQGIDVENQDGVIITPTSGFSTSTKGRAKIRLLSNGDTCTGIYSGY
jgi:hypothetical protein